MSNHAAAEHDPATASTIPAPPKQICSWCRKEVSESEWQSLPHPPRGALQDDGDGGLLELRNHPCTPGGATISRPATREIRGWEVA